jgi:hypothetical protein
MIACILFSISSASSIIGKWDADKPLKDFQMIYPKGEDPGVRLCNFMNNSAYKLMISNGHPIRNKRPSTANVQIQSSKYLELRAISAMYEDLME